MESEVTYLEELHLAHKKRLGRLMVKDRDTRSQLQAAREENEALIRDLGEAREDLLREKSKNRALLLQIELLKQKVPAESAELIAIDREKYAPARILALVAEAHKVTVGRICSSSRTRADSLARFHVVSLLKKHRPDMTTTMIGRALGGKDHSTISNATARWAKLCHKCVEQMSAVDRGLEMKVIHESDKLGKTA